MSAVIVWIFFGLVVGLVGRMLLPGAQPMGWLATIALGIAGSFAGGFLTSLFRGGDMWHPSGMLMSIVGAVVVLAIYLSISKRRTI